MNCGESRKACAEVAELLLFYLCDEVNEQERAAIEAHVAACAQCRTQLDEERAFHTVVRSVPRAADQWDPAGILLAQCRSELAERLDDLEGPAEKQRISTLGWLRGWMVAHPVWSAACLILFGLVSGTQYAQWSSARKEERAQAVVNVRPNSVLTDEQLSRMNVAGINFTPSPYPGSRNVRVMLNAEQPIELNGNLDDSNVRSVLTFVVKNSDRFDSGVRLDCLDALKSHAEDAEVRSALLTAARKDQNPAVRLKALEALRDAEVDSTVRQALLEALQHDANPGVRVEAVNLLVRSLEESPSESLAPTSPDMRNASSGPMVQAAAGPAPPGGSMENVIRELEHLQRNDPNRYVRLRSAAALRQISSRSDQ